MVLLIQPVGRSRGEPDAMRIVPVFGVRIGHEKRFDAFVERPPVRAAVGRLEYAAAGHPDVHVAGIARIDEDRVQLWAVRRAVLIAAAPRLALRMLVEAIDTGPGRAAVSRPEQALRRRSGIPDPGLRHVAWHEPERVIDRSPGLGLECGGAGRLLPGPPAIGRAEDRRAEVPGPRRREQRLAVARIEQRVMDDVAEKMRTGQLPLPPRGIAAERPQPFARRHQQGCASRHALGCALGLGLHFRRHHGVASVGSMPGGENLPPLRKPGKGWGCILGAGLRFCTVSFPESLKERA